MVVKPKKKSGGKGKKVKVLSLKKETVKNLSDGERKRVKGGTAYVVVQRPWADSVSTRVGASVGPSINSSIGPSGVG